MIYLVLPIFCVLILHPKKFIYNVTQKKRKFYTFKKYSLKYGQLGLKILTPVLITSSFIFRTHMIIKKGTKRSEKTQRSFWFSIFPNQPLSEKPKGSRMGKGKGKRYGWVSKTKPGFIIYELKNLRLGRGFYFLYQLKRKLPISSKIIYLTKGYQSTFTYYNTPIYI